MQYRISRADQRLQHASAQVRDAPRYSGLPGVFFTGQTCVASDGRIMAVKITESPDPPVDAIGIFDKPEMKGRHDEQVYEQTGSGFFVSPAGDRVEISPEGSGDSHRRFPDWKTIIPAENLAEAHVICLDAELLYRLAKALVPKGEKLVVTIEFSPGNLSAVVRAADYADRAGMIALVQCDSDQFTACEILRAVVAGRALVAPTSIPIPASPEPELSLADFSDEDLASFAAFDLSDDVLLALAALDLL